jgi:hypothetical protein
MPPASAQSAARTASTPARSSKTPTQRSIQRGRSRPPQEAPPSHGWRAAARSSATSDSRAAKADATRQPCGQSAASRLRVRAIEMALEMPDGPRRSGHRGPKPGTESEHARDAPPVTGGGRAPRRLARFASIQAQRRTFGSLPLRITQVRSSPSTFPTPPRCAHDASILSHSAAGASPRCPARIAQHSCRRGAGRAARPRSLSPASPGLQHLPVTLPHAVVRALPGADRIGARDRPTAAHALQAQQ